MESVDNGGSWFECPVGSFISLAAVDFFYSRLHVCFDIDPGVLPIYAHGGFLTCCYNIDFLLVTRV